MSETFFDTCVNWFLRHQMRVLNYFVNSFYSVSKCPDLCLIWGSVQMPSGRNVVDIDLICVDWGTIDDF
jgi:hypothetical protein